MKDRGRSPLHQAELRVPGVWAKVRGSQARGPLRGLGDGLSTGPAARLCGHQARRSAAPHRRPPTTTDRRAEAVSVSKASQSWGAEGGPQQQAPGSRSSGAVGTQADEDWRRRTPHRGRGRRDIPPRSSAGTPTQTETPGSRSDDGH